MGRVLLTTDLDKTLLNEHSLVPEECLHTIAEFTAAGGLFSVCTGRPTRGALLYRDLISLVNAPLISYNGACIYDAKSKHVLWQRLLPDAVEPLFCEALKRFPTVGLVLFHGEDDFACTIDRKNSYTEEVTWNREHYRAEVCRMEDFPKPWNKCVMAGPEEDMVHCAKFIRENTPVPLTTILTEGIFLEIMGADVDKGNALAKVAESLSLDRSEVVAVGDSMNDFGMLRWAGTGVAVANAEQPVLESADVIVASNTECGICECIEKIALPLLKGNKG